MGLVTWGRTGQGGDIADLGFRSMASGIAILMAGAAAITLGVSAARAQQAAQPASDKQVDQKKADEKAAADGTLLDKILVISRTGETAIQSLASASHVDQQQLDRKQGPDDTSGRRDD